MSTRTRPSLGGAVFGPKDKWRLSGEPRSDPVSSSTRFPMAEEVSLRARLGATAVRGRLILSHAGWEPAVTPPTR
jgi:hypothetical protein